MREQLQRLLSFDRSQLETLTRIIDRAIIAIVIKDQRSQQVQLAIPGAMLLNQHLVSALQLS
jgi:hypothetical protein